MSKLPIPDLGAYLREQRQNAQMSLRQLAEVAGISNPYLSQIERGLKRPSADILQQIAHGLQLSAESLYVRAGILDERIVPEPSPTTGMDVLSAIAADPALTDRQQAVLVDIYQSFVGGEAAPMEGPTSVPASAARAKTRTRPSSPRTTGKTPETTDITDIPTKEK
ncbi:MAG: helix-turn-helix transcriptional regulator [Dermatophilaceae bacterium]